MKMKRLLLALVFAGLLSPVYAAGTIPFSLSQQLDTFGKPLGGCKLYTIVAGTTAAPQNAYKDSALTLPHTNPVLCDAAGRLPQFFLADGTIKIRLTNKNGLEQVVADGVLVIGPSGGGGGGGGSVDPTTIFQTGALMPFYGTGTRSGFVRANGRTIGSATSGATERANADVQSLFEYLCATDLNLVMSGGRGASCNADWVANKTLATPDYRGRTLAGLDDMGNSAAGRLTASYFGATATVLGAAGGVENTTLTLAQLPTNITVTGTVTVATTPGETFPTVSGTNWSGPNGAASGPAAFQAPIANSTVFNRNAMSGANTLTSNNTSGNAHRTVQPTILATIYLKL